MKKNKIALRNSTLLFLLMLSFIACDKEFASLDSDIITNENTTHFNTNSIKYDVVAYNKALGGFGNESRPVQTNNLPVNMFGVYDDPLYGKTTASFVTQVNSTLLDPDFGENTELDSVVLTIPYFSTPIESDGNGGTIYQLDSIFGEGFINFSVYENNYFLRSFDPNSEFNTVQRYYSNASTSQTEIIDPSQLEGQLLYTNQDLFKPNPNQIILTSPPDENGEKEVLERQAPALRIKMDLEFWQQKIFDMEGSTELSNQNNFNDYFRGLYFKAETASPEGNLSILNLSANNANITLYYTKDPFTEGDDRDQTSYILNFTGNKVNFLANEYNVTLQDGDPVNGDEKLFIKGGQGSMALINLFDGDENGDSPILEEFKSKNWLINEANLVFYVDQNLVQGQEPDRIYLYDFKNETPLIDYYRDIADNSNPINSRVSHLGALERENNEQDGQGIRYKIRITEHINNILLRDSTNVKLGLVVSGNINFEGNTLLYNLQTEEESFNKIPGSSIISPRGTVLYGNNTPDEDKKLYLEIFYTEPNN
jgi:hypothetical protein